MKTSAYLVMYNANNYNNLSDAGKEGALYLRHLPEGYTDAYIRVVIDLVEDVISIAHLKYEVAILEDIGAKGYYADLLEVALRTGWTPNDWSLLDLSVLESVALDAGLKIATVPDVYMDPMDAVNDGLGLTGIPNSWMVNNPQQWVVVSHLNGELMSDQRLDEWLSENGEPTQ